MSSHPKFYERIERIVTKQQRPEALHLISPVACAPIPHPAQNCPSWAANGLGDGQALLYWLRSAAKTSNLAVALNKGFASKVSRSKGPTTRSTTPPKTSWLLPLPGPLVSFRSLRPELAIEAGAVLASGRAAGSQPGGRFLESTDHIGLLAEPGQHPPMSSRRLASAGIRVVPRRARWRFVSTNDLSAAELMGRGPGAGPRHACWSRQQRLSRFDGLSGLRDYGQSKQACWIIAPALGEATSRLWRAPPSPEPHGSNLQARRRPANAATGQE